MRAIGEKSSNSPRSESRASVSKGDEEGWSGSHVTAVMMRSVGDTVGPFIYMGSRRAFDRGWGRETRREKERGRAHRWPLESGHAVMRRKRPLLALPLPSSPFTPPLHGFTTLSRRDNGRWRNSPVTRARARARVRLPRAIASSLRSHPGTIAMTQSSRVAGTLRCRYSCRNRKCVIGRLSMYVWRSRNPSRQEGQFFQSTLLRSSSLRSRTARPHILWILRVFYVWKCHSPVQVITFSCNRDITSIYRVLCSPLLAHEGSDSAKRDFRNSTRHRAYYKHKIQIVRSDILNSPPRSSRIESARRSHESNEEEIVRGKTACRIHCRVEWNFSAYMLCERVYISVATRYLDTVESSIVAYNTT